MSGPAAPNKYLVMFESFFSKPPPMSSTYQPVFLRSLLDVGDYDDPEKADILAKTEDNNPETTTFLADGDDKENWVKNKDGRWKVSLHFIAARFAKYYWDMEYSFKLRQSNDHKDVNILGLIEKKQNGKKPPPSLECLEEKDMKEFREDVIKKSIWPEVLKALQKNVMAGLFTRPDPWWISLDDEAVTFLRTHKAVLHKGLVGVLAGKLERLNRMTPQISNKIDYRNQYRGALSTDQILKLDELQDSRCFYCESKNENMHTDHVIPFDFIFSTDFYNCVRACQPCNCTKSNVLPERKFFDWTLERNETLDDYMKKSDIKYNHKSYECMFDMCVSDYNGDRDFFTPSKTVGV